MRPVFDQVRRLRNALALPLAQQSGATPVDTNQSGVQSGPRITMEMIEAVLPGGTYQVLGVTIPASGEAALEAGQMVPVAWRDGRPAVILEHQVRRAGFAAPPALAGAAHIEELLLLKVAPDPTNPASHGVWDVWFRDDKFFVPLKLDTFINHDGTVSPEFEGPPLLVRWGLGADTFVVETSYQSAAPHLGTLVPRFYMFRINRSRSGGAQGAPSAALAKTLSPPLVNNGVYLSATAQEFLVPQAVLVSDLILTAELDVLILVLLPGAAGLVGGSPALGLTEDVALVWSAGSNNLVSTLPALNGSPYNTPPPADVPGTTSNSNTRKLFQLQFVTWDTKNPTKQIVFCESRYITNVITFTPPNQILLFTVAGTNLRQYPLATGGGAVAPSVIPDQTGTFTAVNVFPAPAAETAGVVFELFTTESFGSGGASTSALYVLADRLKNRTATTIDAEDLGVISVPDNAFIVTQHRDALALSDIAEPMLDYLRWVGDKLLYSVPLTASILSPTIPVPKTRDEVVQVLSGAPAVPTLTFFPNDQLKKNGQIVLPIMQPWLKTLPTTENAQNSATEAVLQQSLVRASYRLVG